MIERLRFIFNGVKSADELQHLGGTPAAGVFGVEELATPGRCVWYTRARGEHRR